MERIDSVRADSVFGWRQLNKHRPTSAAAILSLGLAIGACTATVRLIDSLFLRPLPITDRQSFYVVSRRAAYKFGDGWEHMRFRRMRAAMKGHADLIAVSLPEKTDLSYGAEEAMKKVDEIAIRAQTLVHGAANPEEVIRDVITFATAGRRPNKRSLRYSRRGELQGARFITSATTL